MSEQLDLPDQDSESERSRMIVAEKSQANSSEQNQRRPSDQPRNDQSHPQVQPKQKLLSWVEKINANLETEAELGHHRASLANNNGTTTLIQVDQIDPSDDNCFKAAQLVTEILLMLFAGSLLIIAAIVSFSRRMPAFMDSYENVPKFLFILCVVVVLFSFGRWLTTKIYMKTCSNKMCPAKRCNEYSSIEQNEVQQAEADDLNLNRHPSEGKNKTIGIGASHCPSDHKHESKHQSHAPKAQSTKVLGNDSSGGHRYEVAKAAIIESASEIIDEESSSITDFS